ncbi:MAG: right-handed parallel beta-helix repeat-containing protein [Flavobacteriales bacterium]|nr:right-handed parallel beta-helix repeat-containing protein [Flavobacteriales bacterium]
MVQQARVRGCTFTGRTGGDSTSVNGDGLDASGSHLLVQDCLFVGLRDKGVSIGESSQVFSKDCTFRNNGLAIAVKDLSIAHADGNAFIGNRIVFGVYQKKPVFGGGVLTVYNNTLEGNGQEREVDSRSKIVSSGKVDEKVEEAFNVTEDR